MATTTTHARLSPSSAVKWMACPASVVLEAKCPDRPSAHADEGTAAHELAAMVFRGVWERAYEAIGDVVCGRTVDEEMASYAQEYVDYVNSIPGTKHIEQLLDINDLTGEPDAIGTPDAVIVDSDDLTVVDFKYGKGVVVEAEDNPQLMLYALAALGAYRADFKCIKLVIFQPRINHVSEWEYSPGALERFAIRVKLAADKCSNAIAWDEKFNYVRDGHFNPGESQCRWCRAKPTCPALRDHALSTVADSPVDTDKPIAPQLEGIEDRDMDNATLGNLLGSIDLIEGWCKAIRAKAKDVLFSGHDVPGFKLVRGKRGARQWVDEEKAREAVLSMGIDISAQFTECSFMSPAKAEERIFKKCRISPAQWTALQAHIIQPEGSAQIVPESDKRAPFVAVSRIEDFQPA